MEVVPLSSSLLGTELGNRYRLEEQRAATGVLLTWQATDGTLDRSVTVVTVSGPTVEETVDAARKMSVLTDARLAVVLDVGRYTHDDTEYAYVVYEDVAGSSLADWVTRGPVAAEAARAVIGEAALGLDRAAQSGLRHGRLTARHVVQSPTGDLRVEGTAVEAAALGVTTPDAELAAQIDARDLVRLLCHALTGHAVPDQVTAETFVPPSTLVGSVPSDLDRLCREVLTGQATSVAASPKDVAEALAPWGRVPTCVLETSLLPPVPAPGGDDAGSDAGELGATIGTSSAGASSAESGTAGSGGSRVSSRGATAGVDDADSVRQDGSDAGFPVVAGVTEAGVVSAATAKRTDDSGDEDAAVGDATGNRSGKTADSGDGHGGTAGPGAVGGTSGSGDGHGGTGSANDAGSTSSGGSDDAAASGAQWAAAGAAAAAAVATQEEVDRAAKATPGRVAAQTKQNTPEGGALAEQQARDGLPVATAAMTSPETQVSPIWGPPDGEPLFADVSLEAFSGHSWAGRDAKFFIGAPDHPGFSEPSQAHTPAEERRPFEEAVGTHQFAVKPRSSRSTTSGGQVIRLVGLAVLACLAVAVVVLAIDNSINGAPGRPAATPTQQVPSLPESLSATEDGEPDDQAPTEEPAPETAPVTLSTATAFDPEGGDGENDSDAKKAIDGSDTSFWPTSSYRSKSFGNLKDGVGLLVSIPDGASINQVTVLDRGKGGEVELRAATSKSVADSKVLGSFTPNGKEQTVDLSEALETPYLLVWYTELPKATDGEYRGELATVRVQ